MSYDLTDYGYTSEGFCANPQHFDDSDYCKDRIWREHMESVRYKEGARLIAGLRGKKQIKLVLVQKVYQEGIDAAVVRYMKREALPSYYATIVKNHQCIDLLVLGILCKVCRVKTSKIFEMQVADLRGAIRDNRDFLSPYDRVSRIQQFIHHKAEEHLGIGAADMLPVEPMKNALSAARLHLSISDVMQHHAAYSSYIDDLAIEESRLEYAEPRPAQLGYGKRYYPRWRVRHLLPFSYFYSRKRSSIIEELNGIDESVAYDEFVKKALYIFVTQDDA